MLTLAIIVGSIALGGSVVTVASLHFTKWYMERVEGYDLKETRFDRLPRIKGNAELKVCPLCSWDRDKNKAVFPGVDFLKQKEANGFAAIRSRSRAEKLDGPTSALAVETISGQRVYQGCTRCGGEWLLERPEKKGTTSSGPG